jgi:hypothetical protein
MCLHRPSPDAGEEQGRREWSKPYALIAHPAQIGDADIAALHERGRLGDALGRSSYQRRLAGRETRPRWLKKERRGYRIERERAGGEEPSHPAATPTRATPRRGRSRAASRRRCLAGLHRNRKRRRRKIWAASEKTFPTTVSRTWGWSDAWASARSSSV